MRRRRYDRMWSGTDDDKGTLVEVFDPPWWRIDRWIKFYVRVPRAERAKMTMWEAEGTRTVRARVIRRPDVQVIPWN